MARKGTLIVGFDPRRHVLTIEERRRGGYTRWLRTMAELRVSMRLDLPSAKLRQMALELRHARPTTRAVRR